LTPSWVSADEVNPMDVLRGAVKEFFQVKTLEAKIERKQVSGVGRKAAATFFVRYAHPNQFFLESLEPAGFVEAYRDGALVAWNVGAKQGFKGNVEALSQEEREQLLLIPGFRLNPLIPINPKAYSLKAKPLGKSRVSVQMSPKQGGHPPIEIDFLTQPYRVETLRIDGGDWRLETTYSGWKEQNGAWIFGEVRTIKWEERLQKEETLRFYDVKVNEALPTVWLPTELPEGFERIGREFFTANMQ
jgi:hypothetical protein